jgi:hypothetical protein
MKDSNYVPKCIIKGRRIFSCQMTFKLYLNTFVMILQDSYALVLLGRNSKSIVFVKCIIMNNF